MAKDELEKLLMEAFFAERDIMSGVRAIAKVMTDVCAGVAHRVHDETPSSMYGDGPAQHGWRSASSTIEGVIRTLAA